MTQLALGTAQFGGAYGITNRGGRMPDATVRAVLDVAERAGIDTFDTSPEYGDAQQRLGRLAVATSPRYVSKFALPADGGAPGADTIWRASGELLGAASLEGMLFHRTADLRDPRAQDAWELLVEARDAGDIRRIGASVYDADDLATAVAALPGLDVVQLPGSILDRRLLDHVLVADLRAAGVQIHVRSAFLQGLLLSDPGDLPSALADLRPAIQHLRAEAELRGVGVAALALGFLREHPAADVVVIGATTPDELDATAAAWATPVSDALAVDPGPLSDALLDPRLWPRGGDR